MQNSSVQCDPAGPLLYLMNTGLNTVLSFFASQNIGPTKGTRALYLWSASVAQAWNWVTLDTNITGVHDGWDWTTNKMASGPLLDNDSIIWMSCVIDTITPLLGVTSYASVYSCPRDTIARVQAQGQWTNWLARWQTWYNLRNTDGYATIITQQPTTSANWNNTIVVDSQTDVTQFPEPQQWTRLTVQGKKQNYLTYHWNDITSTCLQPADELAVKGLVQPAVGLARDAEIDSMLHMSQTLTDNQKIIAEFWADSAPGVFPPPLMFVWLWKQYMRATNVVPCSTTMYSLLDLSIHLFEGGRITWGLKGQYMQDRPIQEIRRRYMGQSIQSWTNQQVDGSQWVPYQMPNFVTPPFPDFTSGHSHFAKAFSLTMQKWFGHSITKNPMTYDIQPLISNLFSSNQTAPFGDFVINPGASTIQPGVTPRQPVTLSYQSWEDIATDAGMSRLYGGIHTLTAHTASQTTATAVDALIQTTWNIQTTVAINGPVLHYEVANEVLVPDAGATLLN
jgi:hypothetical protein